MGTEKKRIISVKERILYHNNKKAETEKRKDMKLQNEKKSENNILIELDNQMFYLVKTQINICEEWTIAKKLNAIREFFPEVKSQSFSCLYYNSNSLMTNHFYLCELFTLTYRSRIKLVIYESDKNKTKKREIDTKIWLSKFWAGRIENNVQS